MIPAITEINFPAYATLHQATVSLQEMGERTISTQVRIDGDIAPSFDDWELRFKGERFILPHKDPQAAKDNTTRNSLVDLTFTSWANQELKRYFFFEPTSVNAGTVIADKYQASVNLNIEDFVPMLNQVLDYYFDGKIVASLYMSGQGIYSLERSSMEIDHTYLWDVIVKMFEVYGVRWKIVYNSTTDVYTIQFGYPADRIDDHDFEYGYQGGLLRFERQVQDADLKNILLGRGGEKNLPYRYFKRTDETNESTSIWAADPDAIPELANIYFDRIRDINFRWYVRGWMQNPRRDTSWEQQGYVYPTYSIQSDSPYYFAYEKGRTDEKFNPVEYVKDDASIAEYGERWGALEDNDEIFPTIQGRSIAGIGRIDETVDVSEIVTDDIDAAARSAAIERSIAPMTISLNADTRTQFELRSEEFTVPAGSVGEITYIPLSKATENGEYVYYDTDNTRLVAVSVDSGTEYPFGSIPQGRYYLKLYLTIFRDTFVASSATGTFGIEGIVLTTSAMDTDAWKPTFDIWVKNIWQTTQGQNENDAQYAERVWLPILGDRAGNEAKVVFSSGMMSISQDYEFTIASYPVPDRSKVINGVPSEWKITLRKSDAEFDATGLFIPNASTGGKPVAGDYFFFIGIDMPNLYVRLAEEELNAAKAAQLETETTISPTWIINLDKVRVHTLEDGEYGQTLADRLAAGATVWITDPRFTPGQRLQLYVQSITYTWNEPSDGNPYLVPDIEVVLSDKVIATEGTVTRIQNEVEAIKTQYAKTSDIEAAVRRVAEPIFLKKTGESDSSDSPTTFSSKITSKGFRQGGIGGTGWGIYRDNIDQLAEAPAPAPATRALRAVRLTAADEPETNLEGDTVIEVDKVIVRKEMHVNSLVINQIAYVGGKEIISAAKMEASQVVENANSYTVYFDQKQNSVANLFQVGDIAYGQRWSADESTTSYYKMVVSAVDVNSITLDKSPKDGSGIPAKGDVIVQYGSTTNSARRYVIVRDVIGGGYERMLSGLNSVSADGNEYYFAGRESGSGPRWFVGDSAGEYAEWENGQLNIKGRLTVRKSDGTYVAMSQFIADNDVAYLRAATNNGATLVDGGLILSNLMALGQTVNSQFSIQAGMNGMMNIDRTRLGGGVAAWYGGDMSDKDDLDTGVTAYAKSLFRFDGSGYLAGGNIFWNNQGYGGIPGVTWSRVNNQDVVTIGANVRLASVNGDTVTDLLNAVNQISEWFEEVNLGTAQDPAWALRLKKKVVGNTELNRAFVTPGDQIVIDGTPSPGGGGGGGATTLYSLLDIYGHENEVVKRADGTDRQNGDLLAFNSTLRMWVALDQSSITTDLTNYYTKSQTDTAISTAISALNLGAAATYGIGSVASGNTGLVTGGSVYSAINEAVSSVLKMQGTTTTAISDGSTTNPVVIDGSSYTAKKGDVVMYGNKEFWWTGSAWEELGDEASWALKTTTISAGTGLTGGGTLASNRTISLSDSTIASLSLADSAYQKPSTGIPQTDLASALSTKVDNGSTAYGYFSNGILPYNHGGTGISSYTKGNIIYASANNTLAKLAPNTGTKQFLTMTSSVPSWGGVDETDVFGSSAIGSTSLPVYYTGSALATITSLDLLSKNTGYIKGNRFYLASDIYFEYDSDHGYVTLNAPFVTSGDQIVISGTPGGGGGGGATNLKELEDVYHNASGVRRYSSGNATSTDLLGYDSTKGWYAVQLGTGLSMTNGVLTASTGSTYTAGYAISIAQSAISVAHTNEDTDPISFDPDTHTGLDASNLVEWGVSTHANCAKLTIGVGSDSPVSKDVVLASGYDYLLGLINSQVAGVSSVAGKTGAVTLEIADVTGLQTALNGKQAAGNYLTSVPLATSSAIGGIQIGYTQSGKNYPVELSSNKAYVYVPWENTTYSNATTSAAGLMSATDKTKLNGIAEGANNYSLPTASSSTLGGIKIGTGLTIDSSGVVSVTGQTAGTVTAVKVGSTAYNPDGSGIVSLPAYPTVPTNVSAFTNDAGYITSYTNTWRNVYTGGTSRVGTGTDTKAINFAAGTGISISYKAAGTGSGQSGSANYFSVEIGVTANTYQPLDSDLTAIAAISSGTGLLKRSVSGTTVSWSIDTNSYITGITADMMNTAYGFTITGTANATYALATIASNASNGNSAYSTVTGNQTKNKVFASPSNTTGAPSFRALVAADIPDISGTYVTNTALSTWAGTTNITTLGTITSGTWSATTIAVNKGGTGLTTWTGAYRLVYSTAATTLTTLAPNSTTIRKFLRQVGANNAATAPAWDTVTKDDVGLGNVPNWVYTIKDSSAQNFVN